MGLIEYADTPHVGRFGSFAKVADLDEFVSLAIAVELGASTKRHCARKTSENEYPHVCNVDVEEATIRDLVTFLRFLAPPRSRPDSEAGLLIFNAIGCDDCHNTKLHTKANAPEPLKHLTFQPFSDFERHDLGGRERVRTAPLWGLSSFGPPYMHDAKSQSISSAISRHQGEASVSRQRYEVLSPEARETLMNFLSDL